MHSHDSAKPRQLDSGPRRRSISLALPRRLLAGLLALGFGAMIFGLVEIGIQSIPIASAACQPLSPCGLDPTAHAILDVDHQTTGGNAVVPDDSESWQISAVWSTTSFVAHPCMCQDTAPASVTATATYSSTTGWSVSCTGCTGPINGVSICEVGQGCDNPAGKLGYKLLVDIDHTVVGCGGNPATLNRVTFTTTSVDDGLEVDEEDCTLGSGVSPTSQSWSTTDNGAFECSGTCSSTGAAITIFYN